MILSVTMTGKQNEERDLWKIWPNFFSLFVTQLNHGIKITELKRCLQTVKYLVVSSEPNDDCERKDRVS